MARSEARRTLVDDEGNRHEYYATQLPAGEGWRLLVKLFAIAGGAVGRSFGALTPANLPKAVDALGGFLDSGIDGEGIATALEKLAMQLLSDDDIINKLLTTVARDEKRLSNPVEFDAAFAGNYGELIAALLFSLKLNYAPFFKRGLGGSSGLLDTVKAKVLGALNLKESPKAA